jgi:phosphoenolpyruvate carboxylase
MAEVNQRYLRDYKNPQAQVVYKIYRPLMTKEEVFESVPDGLPSLENYRRLRTLIDAKLKETEAKTTKQEATTSSPAELAAAQELTVELESIVAQLLEITSANLKENFRDFLENLSVLEPKLNLLATNTSPCEELASIFIYFTLNSYEPWIKVVKSVRNLDKLKLLSPLKRRIFRRICQKTSGFPSFIQQFQDFTGPGPSGKD